MVGAALYSILSGIVHVYPLRAAQGAAFPLATYQVTNVTPAMQINGTNKLFEYDVQINISATTYDAVSALSRSVLGTLDRYSNAAIQSENVKDIRHMGGPEDLFQDDADVYTQAIDVKMWITHNT